MANVILYYGNLLETSTVSVSNENTSFPKYRLYDRDIGKLFKGSTNPTNYIILIDQVANMHGVSGLIIPAGHNLNGRLCTLQYSTDAFAADINTMVEWTQSGSGLIHKSFANTEKRYWRLVITGTDTLPELAEFFLYTYWYTFVQNVAYEFQEKKHRNVSRRETGSGKLRTKKYGEARRYRNYKVNFFLAAQKTAFEDWETRCEGFKSIYVSDYNGDLIFMEILNEITFVPASDSLWSTELELMEVLA